jgi:hypothetical protein
LHYETRDRELSFRLGGDLLVCATYRKCADAKEKGNGRSVSEISPVPFKNESRGIHNAA